ncbi:MAG: hypothetical protein KIS92_14065 [Planctomycetota bacterium]|nr:hypothetical protein [Planctomycetota bacterium]
MRDLIYTALGYVLMLAAIIGVFKLFKSHHRAVIEANDHSMEPEYRNGSHSIDSSVRRVSDLTLDTAVAYYLPGQPDQYRVAWVVAKEGQRVKLVFANGQGKIFVDGQPSQAKVLGFTINSPEFIVPRGCVYVVASAPENDSLNFGPLPMRNIRGSFK